MMGHQKRVQQKLFYSKLNLNQRIRNDHILRQVKRYIVMAYSVGQLWLTGHNSTRRLPILPA